ncbi:hypothetical protein LJC34_00145 [Oscillospiraceae bacterium OttesenSCG-928-G22]|nr:hypothetical protein [Oscillospiraceae bacterium OttesenSCG-928-G22]
MPGILRVDTVGGDMLDVQMDNGNIVLLSLKLLLSDARFAELMEDDRVFYPHTDGICVFWKNGPRLTLEELERMAFGNA